MKIRTLYRVAFVIYTVALLTATHWPGLAVPKGPVSRMDLVIHAGAFAIWTVLFFVASWIPIRCRSTTRRIVLTSVIGMCFAAFDELTQPLFTRVADWTDFIADIAGVMLASLLLFAWGSVAYQGKNTRSEEL